MTDDTALLEADREAAEMDAGFDGKELEKPAAKQEKPKLAETPREEAISPKYIQITEDDWAHVKAAAAKTASYDQQLSKAFGTIGNLQKLVNSLQTNTPRGGKVEIPAAAFADMEKDFPELAQQTRAALEAALAGVTGSGANDAAPVDIEKIMSDYTAKRQIKELEEEWPDWREIVGAVDVSKEQPNPDNPFRKWLKTKDAAYQARINGTESAAVVDRAIRRYHSETTETAKAAPSPAATARADRIKSAVQPKGDNAGAAPGKSDQDEFEAGFHSR